MGTCDPSHLVVMDQTWGGYVEPCTVARMHIGGVGLRPSFRKEHVVWLGVAAPGHLQAQGYDVVAEFPEFPESRA